MRNARAPGIARKVRTVSCFIGWRTVRVADNKGDDQSGGARVLESLRKALAAWPGLGSWARVSIEQWSSFTAGEAKAYQDVSISAVRSVANWRTVEDQIST